MLATKAVGQSGASAPNAAQLRDTGTRFALGRLFNHSGTLRIAERSSNKPLPGNALFTQVTISFVDPVGPRRIEDVEVNRVFHGLSFVRHIWRDGEHFSGGHHNFFSIDIKLQCAFENIAELFVNMAVQRNYAALLK